MKIAVVGATSQIAGDWVKHLKLKNEHVLFLYGRVANTHTGVKDYREFGNEDYDVVVNFVGVGDPARAADMGASILEITNRFDDMVLAYLERKPTCRYVFLSSGAAFGSGFEEAASENTLASFRINQLGAQDWYGVSKFYAEAKHRALKDLGIVDLRVFNYLSYSQSIESRFMITDAARAIYNRSVFKTNSLDLVRDYLSKTDFCLLMDCILNAEKCNCAVDCFSAAPVSKFELLNTLNTHFGLQVEVAQQIDFVNATGVKLNYFSTNHTPALRMGYKPQVTSIDNVVAVVKAWGKTFA